MRVYIPRTASCARLVLLSVPGLRRQVALPLPDRDVPFYVLQRAHEHLNRHLHLLHLRLRQR